MKQYINYLLTSVSLQKEQETVKITSELIFLSYPQLPLSFFLKLFDIAYYITFGFSLLGIKGGFNNCYCEKQILKIVHECFKFSCY